LEDAPHTDQNREGCAQPKRLSLQGKR